MNKKIVINPGNPNDENRHYLPVELKGSDMVVNENGNDSIPYPERLKEYSDVFLDDVRDSWYEYIPESYDGTKKVPLVISMHGGAMTGWGQAVYTSWTLVAEREGFIAVFPDASEHNFWIVEISDRALEVLGKPNPEGFYLNQFPENADDNHDMNFVLALIDKLKQKYNIDESRIFMQGMSMGNMMTSQFARYHGEVLAAMAGSAGPTHPSALYKDGKLSNRSGSLGVWQSRMELDQNPEDFGGTTQELVTKNRDYWKKINGCNGLPQIKIVGENNFAFYKGESADYVFRDVKNRDHGQTMDDAELVWDYLFSATSRGEDGRIIHTEPICERKGDDYAIALAVGSAKAYVNNQLVQLGGPVFLHKKLKYHGLNGDALVRGEYFMTPVSFVADALGAKCAISEDSRSAELTLKDGRVLQFARGVVACLVDNRVHSMSCEPVLRDGQLYVPIEWICKNVLNNQTSRYEDVLYITDHFAELSINMAQLLRDEILA